MAENFKSFVNEGTTELLNIIISGLINREEREVLICSYIDMMRAHLDGHKELIDHKVLIDTCYCGCIDKRIAYYSEIPKLSLLQCNMGISLCEELNKRMTELSSCGVDTASVRNCDTERWVSFFTAQKEAICNETKVFYASLHPVKVQGKYGFANNENITVIQPIYDKVKPFSCDRAKVYRDKKYGFIDRSGDEVIKPVYDEADDFENNRARVVNNGLVMIIDVNGNTVG